MKIFFVLALAVLAPKAFATPGDIGCKGLVGGESVSIVIGRDHFGQPPVFMEVYRVGKLVAKFSADQISEGIESMTAIESDPIKSRYYRAINKIDDVYLRLPEFSPEHSHGRPSAYLNLSVPSAQLLATDVGMECEF